LFQNERENFGWSETKNSPPFSSYLALTLFSATHITAKLQVLVLYQETLRHTNLEDIIAMTLRETVKSILNVSSTLNMIFNAVPESNDVGLFFI